PSYPQNHHGTPGPTPDISRGFFTWGLSDACAYVCRTVGGTDDLIAMLRGGQDLKGNEQRQSSAELSSVPDIRSPSSSDPGDSFRFNETVRCAARFPDLR